MDNVKIKTNWDNEELFCVSCKEKIEIGEKYLAMEVEVYDGVKEYTFYHLDCIPEDSDNDEVYIGE